MKKTNALIVFALVLLSFGCKSVDLVSPDAKAVLLRTQQTATKGPNTIQLPAGVYEPDFQTAEGIYYRAPGHIISKALGISSVMRGGLFIPFESQKDKRQGAWVDHQEGSGGFLVAGLTSNKRILRFKDPIQFEMVESRAGKVP